MDNAAARLSVDGLHWLIGVAVALAAIAMFGVAVAFAPSSTRANMDSCLQQVAKEKNVSVDAFFQNPALQDAFVEGVTLCSR